MPCSRRLVELEGAESALALPRAIPLSDAHRACSHDAKDVVLRSFRGGSRVKTSALNARSETLYPLAILTDGRTTAVGHKARPGTEIRKARIEQNTSADPEPWITPANPPQSRGRGFLSGGGRFGRRCSSASRWPRAVVTRPRGLKCASARASAPATAPSRYRSSAKPRSPRLHSLR